MTGGINGPPPGLQNYDLNGNNRIDLREADLNDDGRITREDSAELVQDLLAGEVDSFSTYFEVSAAIHENIGQEVPSDLQNQEQLIDGLLSEFDSGNGTDITDISVNADGQLEVVRGNSSETFPLENPQDALSQISIGFAERGGNGNINAGSAQADYLDDLLANSDVESFVLDGESVRAEFSGGGTVNLSQLSDVDAAVSQIQDAGRSVENQALQNQEQLIDGLLSEFDSGNGTDITNISVNANQQLEVVRGNSSETFPLENPQDALSQISIGLAERGGNGNINAGSAQADYLDDLLALDSAVESFVLDGESVRAEFSGGGAVTLSQLLDVDAAVSQIQDAGRTVEGSEASPLEQQQQFIQNQIDNPFIEDFFINDENTLLALGSEGQAIDEFELADVDAALEQIGFNKPVNNPL